MIWRVGGSLPSALNGLRDKQVVVLHWLYDERRREARAVVIEVDATGRAHPGRRPHVLPISALYVP